MSDDSSKPAGMDLPPYIEYNRDVAKFFGTYMSASRHYKSVTPYFLLQVLHQDWPSDPEPLRDFCSDRRSKLRLYDPTLGNGPWWHDKPNNKHYRNGSSICLEFLIEKDLRLADVKSIEFVDHHPQWCSINRNNPITCPEIGMSRHKAGWRFLANVIGVGLDLNADMISYISHDNTKGTNPIFKEAANDIMLEIKRYSNNGNIYIGCVSIGDDACEPLARAIIGAIGRDNITEAKALMKLFESENAAIGAYTSILEALIKFPIHNV